MPSASLLRAQPAPPSGYTPVTRADDAVENARFPLGIDFGLWRLGAGEEIAEQFSAEAAWVLLQGEAEIRFAGERRVVRRASVFDEPPTVLHVSREEHVAIIAGGGGAEWALIRTANSHRFAARLFTPQDLQPEYRGAGLVQNACLRNVRLIFDRATRPESNLVVGEVVNYPGRWSSYPPHHHDQPEIYHYRFTEPDGYGHAELGDTVVKVRQGDTTVIPPGRDHAQVSAPGYGMYYLWIIRHLPGNPYTGFTFAPEHAWALDAARQGWRPADLPQGLA